MNDKRYIAIFCSAKNTISTVYFDIAQKVSTICAQKGYALIYGGDTVGLMGCVSQTFAKFNQKIVGVCTKGMLEKQKYADYCDELIVAPDLKSRKDIMIRRANILLVLPGGIGTLDELFTALTLKDLGYNNKTIILLNCEGFFDDLLTLLARLQKENFLKNSIYDLMNVVTKVESLHEVLG